MDLKVALKRVLTVCVTTAILSTSLVLAKGKPATAPPENVPASIDMAKIKSLAEMKAAVRKALTNKAVAARVRAEAGSVNYRMLKRALDDPKEPAVETQAVSGLSCWFTCLRSAGVSIYSATVCAVTCAAGGVIACVICAAVSGFIAELCAVACAHEIVRGPGGGKSPVLD